MSNPNRPRRNVPHPSSYSELGDEPQEQQRSKNCVVIDLVKDEPPVDPAETGNKQQKPLGRPKKEQLTPQQAFERFPTLENDVKALRKELQTTKKECKNLTKKQKELKKEIGMKDKAILELRTKLRNETWPGIPDEQLRTKLIALVKQSQTWASTWTIVQIQDNSLTFISDVLDTCAPKNNVELQKLLEQEIAREADEHIFGLMLWATLVRFWMKEFFANPFFVCDALDGTGSSSALRRVYDLLLSGDQKQAYKWRACMMRIFRKCRDSHRTGANDRDGLFTSYLDQRVKDFLSGSVQHGLNHVSASEQVDRSRTLRSLFKQAAALAIEVALQENEVQLVDTAKILAAPFKFPSVLYEPDSSMGVRLECKGGTSFDGRQMHLCLTPAFTMLGDNDGQYLEVMKVLRKSTVLIFSNLESTAPACTISAAISFIVSSFKRERESNSAEEMAAKRHKISNDGSDETSTEMTLRAGIAEQSSESSSVQIKYTIPPMHELKGEAQPKLGSHTRSPMTAAGKDVRGLRDGEALSVKRERYLAPSTDEEPITQSPSIDDIAIDHRYDQSKVTEQDQTPVIPSELPCEASLKWKDSTNSPKNAEGNHVADLPSNSKTRREIDESQSTLVGGRRHSESQAQSERSEGGKKGKKDAEYESLKRTLSEKNQNDRAHYQLASYIQPGSKDIWSLDKAKQ